VGLRDSAPHLGHLGIHFPPLICSIIVYTIPDKKFMILHEPQNQKKLTRNCKNSQKNSADESLGM
jgi:hypothetical protein